MAIDSVTSSKNRSSTAVNEFSLPISASPTILLETNNGIITNDAAFAEPKEVETLK